MDTPNKKLWYNDFFPPVFMQKQNISYFSNIFVFKNRKPFDGDSFGPFTNYIDKRSKIVNIALCDQKSALFKVFNISIFTQIVLEDS